MLNTTVDQIVISDEMLNQLVDQAGMMRDADRDMKQKLKTPKSGGSARSGHSEPGSGTGSAREVSTPTVDFLTVLTKGKKHRTTWEQNTSWDEKAWGPMSRVSDRRQRASDIVYEHMLTRYSCSLLLV